MLKKMMAATAAAMALLGVLPTSTSAADWPTRPVKLVVPFPPGGATDIMARLLAKAIAEPLGQPVIVENRPGAGTVVGSTYVARAEPDGYTLLLAATPLVIAPSLYADLAYDPLKDFAPISEVANIVHVLVVNPRLPVHTVPELITYMKAHPNEVNYGSVGPGTLTHIQAEAFKRQAGVQMVHIPYKGSDPAKTDLIGGRIQLMFDSYPSASPVIRDGKLRALAVATREPTKVVPDLPTVASAGLPGFEVSPWLGVVAPANTPQAIVDRIAGDIEHAIQQPALREKFLELGLEPVQSSPSAFAEKLKTDMKDYAQSVKASGIKVN